MYDKFQHFVIGAVIAVLAIFGFYHGLHQIDPFFSTKATLVAAVIFFPTLAGLAKEWYDRQRGGPFDLWDSIATSLGGAIFIPVILLYF